MPDYPFRRRVRNSWFAPSPGVLAERLGCVLVRERAGHSRWGNPENGRRSTVPRHYEISEVLARKICRDLGIPEP
jgi:mRNA interferase HicA